VNIKLSNGVALPHQSKELALGGFNRRIGHHIKQANVQGANILMGRFAGAQNYLTFLFKAFKSG